MANLKQHKLGWIGIGRMGYAMAERLAKAGCDISVWNRTRSKAEPLAKSGAKVVDNLTDLAGCDIVFTMVSTGKDVKEVLFGPNGVMSKGASGGAPKIVVDSTSISLEESADIRQKLAEKNIKMLAAPVSGNAKVIKAGKLTVVASGPKDAFDAVAPYLDAVGRGSSYVGEGELSRIALAIAVIGQAARHRTQLQMAPVTLHARGHRHIGQPVHCGPFLGGPGQFGLRVFSGDGERVALAHREAVVDARNQQITGTARPCNLSKLTTCFA